GPGYHPVALKFIELQGEADRLEGRALELMKQLRHPHLLTVSAHWRFPGLLVIALDLADGTLLDRPRRWVAHGPPGGPGDGRGEAGRGARRGVPSLNDPRHTVEGKSGVGVTHRDVKPANLLLVAAPSRSGTSGSPSCWSRRRPAPPGAP